MVLLKRIDTCDLDAKSGSRSSVPFHVELKVDETP